MIFKKNHIINIRQRCSMFTVSDQDKDIKISQLMIQIKRRIFTDSDFERDVQSMFTVLKIKMSLTLSILQSLIGKDDNIYSH